MLENVFGKFLKGKQKNVDKNFGGTSANNAKHTVRKLLIHKRWNGWQYPLFKVISGGWLVRNLELNLNCMQKIKKNLDFYLHHQTRLNNGHNGRNVEGHHWYLLSIFRFPPPSPSFSSLYRCPAFHVPSSSGDWECCFGKIGSESVCALRRVWLGVRFSLATHKEKDQGTHQPHFFPLFLGLSADHPPGWLQPFWLIMMHFQSNAKITSFENWFEDYYFSWWAGTYSAYGRQSFA